MYLINNNNVFCIGDVYRLLREKRASETATGNVKLEERGYIRKKESKWRKSRSTNKKLETKTLAIAYWAINTEWWSHSQRRRWPDRRWWRSSMTRNENYNLLRTAMCVCQMKMMLGDVDGLGQFIAKRLMKSELTIHMTDDPTRDKMEFCARKNRNS